MSPKSRPFDEVAVDAFANEGNALEPTPQHVVALDLENNSRECSLLHYFVGVHQDAAAFYKAAADSTRYPALKSQLDALEQLHTAIINNLGLRLRAQSRDPDQYTENVPAAAMMFGEIMHTLTTDQFPTKPAFIAERKAMHMMEAGMEEDISEDARAFIASQVGALSRAEEILGEIKDLQEH